MAHALTADICAHGVIAAARYLGFDPLQAMQARSGLARAAVTATALSLVDLTDLGTNRVARIMGVNASALSTARKAASPAVRTAARHAGDAMTGAGLAPRDKSSPPTQDKRRVPTPATGRPVAPAEPPPPPPRVDHTAAIREALERRRQKAAFEVVGVEADKALLPPHAEGGCAWPLGDLQAGTYRSCGQPIVVGRRYCAAHCRAAGMKAEPRSAAVAGRVAAPWGEGD